MYKEVIRQCTNVEKLFEIWRKAYMNINKRGESSKSEMAKLNSYAEVYNEFIIREIL